MNEASEPRQKVVRVGKRRAKLTPAPGTDTSPESPMSDDTDSTPRGDESPRDAQLRRDKPPHWG